MKKIVIIAGLVLAFSSMVWAQHTCNEAAPNEAAPRELRAPSDAHRHTMVVVARVTQYF